MLTIKHSTYVLTTSTAEYKVLKNKLVAGEDDSKYPLT